ncbi:unnamed protein product [Vitrella brassicaformis CCMP3155]|uniref:N-acetylneuraminate epimerase n=2 Tax=Vitrella brassicaformis TaxID=1169539 RepID=A0A0G4EZ55_VITBC|nr:unnamed protein product [Vitrella brassicaformis CCMP3155]|eukprot:CEM04380.1 unnamed protein product [Vitrella brassicaformis CCMP3155]
MLRCYTSMRAGVFLLAVFLQLGVLYAQKPNVTLCESTGDTSRRRLRGPGDDTAVTLAPCTMAEGGWEEGQLMPEPFRAEIAVVALADGKIYAMGGYGDVSKTVERYDPKTQKWETVAPMPEGRHHLMAAPLLNSDGSLGDSFIALGGFTGDWVDRAPATNAFLYNATTDKWEWLPPLPLPRAAGAAVTQPETGKVYVVGGELSGNEMLIYDPATFTWEVHDEGPPRRREHVGAAFLDNELLVIGGKWETDGSERTSVDIFDPDTSKWTNGPQLNHMRAGFAVGVMNDHVVVAGGEVVFAIDQQAGPYALTSVELLPSRRLCQHQQAKATSALAALKTDTADDTTGGLKSTLEALAAQPCAEQDASSWKWTEATALPQQIHGTGGAVLDGRFYVVGGSTKAMANKPEGHLQIYTPAFEPLDEQTA